MSDTTAKLERPRIHSHITKSSFLHVEDSLEIGKLRLFGGHYKKGNGSSQMAAHWIDVVDARVLLHDMAWGKALDYVEYKGTPGNPPTSRVLKVKSGKDNKVWIRLETGPGTVIGEGAVKPKGDPETVINVPFTIWEARKLGFAVLSYLQAAASPGPTATPTANHYTCPRCNTRPCTCDEFGQFFRDDYVPSGYAQPPNGKKKILPPDHQAEGEAAQTLQK